VHPQNPSSAVPQPSPGAAPDMRPRRGGGSSANASAVGRARADKLALCLFEQLRDRPVADRRFVFRALLGRLARFASNERVDVALRSLAACCAANGERAVSRRSYDAWRRAQSDPREFASAVLIRTTFGSWTKALEALGHDSAGDARARGLVNCGREELIAALRALAPVDGSCLTHTAYLAAARAHNDALPPGAQRFPLAPGAFLRVFGSWARALAAAGLPVSDAARHFADHPNRQAEAPTHGRRNAKVMLGARADYVPERMLSWLQRAARELGSPYLTLKAYDRWAQAVSEAAAARGEVVVVPRAKTIEHRLGWKTALQQAGLISEAERDRLGTGGFSYTDEDLLAGLRRALRHFGGPPSKAAS
jgi:hypothetical protein